MDRRGHVGDPAPKLPARVGLAVLLALGVAGCTLSRAPAREVEGLARVMALETGMHVADVGAGDGKWSEGLAERVGDEGHVYATEVTDERLGDIRRRIRKRQLGNVTVVRGDQADTGLSEGCCDAILLRLVYHHFTDPPRMRESLRRALRPGGVLAVIDMTPQERLDPLDGVPDRGGHGITLQRLVEEMTADGWEEVERHQEWSDDDDLFCVLFRPAP